MEWQRQEQKCVQLEWEKAEWGSQEREQEKVEWERQEQERQHQEEVERERIERHRIEQAALLDEELLSREDIGRLESLVREQPAGSSTVKGDKRGTRIDLQEAVENSPYCVGLPASSSDQKNIEARGDEIETSAAVNTRQETHPDNPTQETRTKVTTLVLIRTQDQRSRGGLIDSATLATRMDKSLDTTKVRINLEFCGGDLWVNALFLDGNPFNPSEVERVARIHVMQKMRLYDTGVSSMFLTRVARRSPGME